MLWEKCDLQYKTPECGIDDCKECKYKKLYDERERLKEKYDKAVETLTEEQQIKLEE